MPIIEILILLALATPVTYYYLKKNKVIPINIDDAILNHEELLHHAEMAAKKHSFYRSKKYSNLLITKLNDNYSFIFNVYKSLNDDSKNCSELPPGSEWLLDNFYIIEQEIKKILQNKSDINTKDLNILKEGEFKNYPRIFAVALELVSHTDGRIEKDQLVDFINSYQSVSTLSMTELWNVQTMIKLALIEKIRNSCKKIYYSQEQWKESELLKGLDTKEIISKIKIKFTTDNYVSNAYIEHLLTILRKDETNADIIINYINNKLIENDLSIEKVVQEEHQEQASHEISIANCISSLRKITSWDWKEIFDSLSLVEKILKDDPSGVYITQDFDTKNYYRQEIKKIADKLNISETFVARCAIKCASEADEKDLKLKHVGYYIVSKGNENLLKLFNTKHVKFMKDNKLNGYLLPIIIVTSCISLYPSYYAYKSGVNSLALFIFIFILTFIPSSEMAISLVNFIISHTLPPTFLPKIEYKDSIPEESSTIVIVPTLITSTQRMSELIGQLEVTYLANKNTNLYFAIVGDFKDSTEENLKIDDDIVKCGMTKIKELNKKYSIREPLFYLFIRKRKYNSICGKWMGWERKRGAILEFNELILGSKETSFEVTSNNIENLYKIKYVITLDADTILPIGSAEKLIGTMAHPLNKAIIDEKTGVVSQGYGLIQPRIGINIESTSNTLFSKIFAGQGGIDIYSQATSDVYQDLFSEGIYTGKGIYDINIFNKCLKNIFPDNTILSHDLLEGSFIRTGLATDIELIDNYPEKYNSYIMRLHRWIRGDWQLLPWTHKIITTRTGTKIYNPLSNLSKWKIIDNLRRSLIQINILIIIILAYTILPGEPIRWLSFALLSLCFPIIISTIEFFTSKGFKASRTKNQSRIVYGIKTHIYQALLNLIFLPYYSYMMSDAIIRTIYRLTISKKQLLEWVTAAEVEKNLKNDIKNFISKMYPAYIISSVFLFLTLLNYNELKFVPVILSLLWIFSPIAAFYISKPEHKETLEIDNESTIILRRIARKTWSFYEDYSCLEDNYLPIDNLQQRPVDKVAHRTSPTNIGFLLMSIISARDLGYITTSQVIEKLDNTITTIEKLDKWNGHLYNWYDTKTLKILRPAYISTVDSGNFIAYLITVRQALEELKNKNLIDNKFTEGINDTINLMTNNNKTYMNKLDNMNLYSFYDSLLNINDTLIDNTIYCEKASILCRKLLQEISLFFPSAFTQGESLVNFNNDIFSDIERILGEINYNNSPIILEKYYTILANKISSILEHKDLNKINCNFLLVFKEKCIKNKENIKELISSIDNILERLDTLINNTNFIYLYDKKQDLFSIGYNIEEDRITNSYYDLLASEARITSYIAISRREIPANHWFKLGRALVVVDGYKSLVSWTGTMFEYFMPALLMKNFRNTLLSETYKTVLKAQIKYGKIRNVPWGTSESGYYTFDLLLNYQYKAFGVPELGLKRGLIKDMVISPYSTILCLPYDTKNSLINIKKLLSEGLEGDYGFYEAVDYTPERLPFNETHGIVESFMAHHQGMILTSLNNFFNDNILVKRFHSFPAMKTGELLLQEKIPTRVIITKEHKDVVEPFDKICKVCKTNIRKCGYDSSYPICHILSNGSYSVMIDNRGSGYSNKDEINLLKFRYNDINEKQGQFIFIKNFSTNKIWSTTYHPFNDNPDFYECKFSADKAEFIRKDDLIETHTEICVSPEDNCEIRKITISNHSNEEVIIETTSYMETVLSEHSAEYSHPAFNKLFITTEFFESYNTILSYKRPKKKDDNALWCFHTIKSDYEKVGTIEYETDRAKFIGRCRDISNATELDKPLSNTCGVVIDPCVSLRQRFKIMPFKSIVVNFITGFSTSKETAIEASIKYNDSSNILRAFELSYIRSLMEMRYINLSQKETECFDAMIPHIIYLSPSKQMYNKIISKNTKGQPMLWSYGISGDIPIVLVTIKDTSEIDVVKNIIKSHEYFRLKGLKIDLVILNEDEGDYLEPLQNLIREVVLSGNSRDIIDRKGGIFIKNGYQMPKEDIVLLFSAAKLIIKSDMSIMKQLKNMEQFNSKTVKAKIYGNNNPTYSYDICSDNLTFFNSFGGFNTKDYEYIINLKENQNTPSPWSNIICNKNFGCMVTESGIGYTWCENSRENKITPWFNDAVSDKQGEVVYISDNDTGISYSTSPLPLRSKSSYEIKHGAGYTSYACSTCDLYQKTTIFVPINEPIKLIMMKLKNNSENLKNVSIYYYIKPVLGVFEESTSQHINSMYDSNYNCIYLNNSYNIDYKNKIAFLSSSETINSFTCDRLEFIGINGSLSAPCGLISEQLSNSCGFCLDPCAVIKIDISLKLGEEKQVVFMLGECNDYEEIQNILKYYKVPANSNNELNMVKELWKKTFNTIQVSTPDEATNLLVNSYLIYQTIACRIWARTAFYQCGGAYGFRDQLQDAICMANINVELLKSQILLCCRHQFVDGDVQHWWHPGNCDKGIRTKFSDDLLWLPYAVSEYIEKTNDFDILNIEIEYLEDEPLKENEDERYGVPHISNNKESIFNHCIKAIEKSLKFGSHGIPLMGSGDWNDGMNTVGNKGSGESVWLGWFLCDILNKFSDISSKLGYTDISSKYKNASCNIKKVINDNAWDGSWYIRAFFDDGTPLGSSSNSECKIDSIAQSWAVISGCGSSEKIKEAMNSAENYLVKKDNGLILLFTPPFDKSDLYPGYIKGYVPGVRENGGQYTHASCWFIYALCKMGMGDKAFDCFSMINPINHTRTQMECIRYKGEPYVMAADVYNIFPQEGRSGWTWYTGSAGWMYKTCIEGILGFNKKGSLLYINPCIPTWWKEYSIRYVYNSSVYNIHVLNLEGVNSDVKQIIIDGLECKENYILLKDNSKTYNVEILMGKSDAS